MKKPFALERKPLPGQFSNFFLLVIRDEWRRYKKYETLERAIQAYEGLMKSSWNRSFEYRLQTPVGIVTLPVVKA